MYQKIRALYITDFILPLLHYFVDCFARAEILGRNSHKNFVGFLVDLKTPKVYFEIN